MIAPVFRVLGIDYRQWLALVRVGLVIDFRAGSKFGARSGGKDSGLRSLIRLLIIQVFVSIVLTTMVVSNDNLFITAAVLLTFQLFVVVSSLLLDFGTIVLSPDDYWIVAHRPVSTRTFFTAKLACVLAYLSLITVALVAIPSAARMFTHGFRPALALASLMSALLFALFASLVVIIFYTMLLTYVRPSRVRAFLSYFQLLASIVFYSSFVVIPQFFHDFALDITLDTRSWLVAIPISWFASFLPLAAGHWTAPNLLAAALGLGSCVVLVLVASRYLSVGYLRAVGESQVSPSAKASALARPRSSRLFRSFEGRAVALLLWNQFRHDQKFRLAVLGILPLTIFYGWMAVLDSPLADPFGGVKDAMSSGNIIYVALLLFPLMLKPSLTYSEWHQAAWIFYTSPARHDRLMVSLKNAVMLYFLLPYMVVVLGVLAYLYGNVWHAAYAVGLAALLAHLLLQVSILFSPDLPFSKPHGRTQRASKIFVILLVGPVLGYSLPILIGAVAHSLMWLVVLAAVPAALSAGVEILMRRRIGETYYAEE